MELKEWIFPFVKNEKLSKDAYAFYFDRVKHGSDFDFLAGQYIRMQLPHQNPDERGTSRLFSLVSSPLNKDYVMITTRIIQSTFKKALLALKPGTDVAFFGPMGQFTLKDKETQPHIFLAGGIGITPVHSIILYAAEKKLSIPLTLFASFSTVDDVVFFDELISIGRQHSNITVVYTVTRPDQSAKPWTGEMGRISADLIKRYLPDFAKSLFYISGPPAMVSAMEEIAKGMNVLPEHIRRENFTGY